MRMFGIAALLALAACTKVSDDPDVNNAVLSGGVAKVAEAPDGTILWAARPGDRVVYFSSRGTQTSHTESCGKNCNRTVYDDVPMAEGR